MQILPLIESLKVKDLITEGLPAKKGIDKEGEADSEYETSKEKDRSLMQNKNTRKLKQMNTRISVVQSEIGTVTIF